MSKHLNDLSAVYMASIAEETVCPVCGFDPCQCLEGTLDESCGCDHEGPKNKMQVGQEKAKEKYSGKKLRDLPGRKKEVEEAYKDFPSDKVDRQASSKLKKGQEKFAKDKDVSAAKKVLGQAKTMRAVQLAQNRVSGARVGMGNTAKSANPQASKAVARTLTKQKDKDREKQADTNLDGHYANQGGRFAAEGKQPIHIGRMLSQASNKDYQASKEKNPSKREKLETQARTIRTTVDMDSFKKRTSKIKPQRAGVQEGLSNWRQDLIEVSDGNFDIPSSQAQKDTEMKQEIKDKKVKNKVLINPPMAVSEAVEALGGTILEFYELDEKINLKKADMGDVVKDFYKSDAPQFKGKSKEKRREMAVAAKLEAERGPQESTDMKNAPNIKDQKTSKKTNVYYDKHMKQYVPTVKEARDSAKEEQGKKIASYEKTGRAFGLIKKFRQENPGSRQPKKVPGAKETEGQAADRRRGAQAQRAAKHGLTSKEKKETQARAKYDSPRD